MTVTATPESVSAFFSRVQFADTGCWLWTGGRSERGYGKFRLKLAHRFSYGISNNLPPSDSGLVLDHLCRVRACVNPDHLRITTVRDNLLCPTSEAPAAINLRKTHCFRGHLLEGDNLALRGDGRRRCKACRLIRGN